MLSIHSKLTDNQFIYPPQGRLKRTPPPPDSTVGVLLLREEEKVKVLIIITFPSFLRRGVMTGWLFPLFQNPQGGRNLD